jgi:hypothetical protein
MTSDKFNGPELEEYWGWKCLMCGEIIDPVILKNRYLMSIGQEIPLAKGGVGARAVYHSSRFPAAGAASF